jgi:hypothetical protein
VYVNNATWPSRFFLISLCRCRDLLLDRVEVGVGEGLLDLLLDPKIRRHVGHVCRVSRAGTAGEQADDTSQPVNDNGPRIPGGGECAVLVAVGVDGDLHRRRLDAVVVVYSNEGLYIGSATDGDTSALTVFDEDKTLLSVCVERVRLAYFLLLDDAFNLQETANRILEGGAALGVRVHLEDEVGGRNLASWIYSSD